jgi:8-oxo-dGTP pyrophosphatase MutT (NUDIX family)
MKKLVQNVIFCGVFIFAAGCGKVEPHRPVDQTEKQIQGSREKSRQKSHEKKIRLPVVRTQVSTTPVIQFNAPIGNAPQRPFDPTYQPKSRSRNPNLSRESAGALIYTTGPKHNSEVYVLIGQEKSNGFWNFMRGSVDAGDSFVEAAVNELNQETGGAYQVTEAVLLSESYDVYRSPTRGNYACTFFVKMKYVPAQVILRAANSHPDHHFREMKAYAWIPLRDLKKALDDNTSRFSTKTITGETGSFDFYRYSFEILKQAHSKSILDQLN